MHRVLTFTFLLLGLVTPVAAQSPELAAAKKAHVDRFWESCTTKHAGSTTICADFVRALEARERKALKRIASETTDSNKLQISEGIVGCYSPRHDYKDLVQCWELVAGDLEGTGE